MPSNYGHDAFGRPRHRARSVSDGGHSAVDAFTARHVHSQPVQPQPAAGAFAGPLTAARRTQQLQPQQQYQQQHHVAQSAGMQHTARLVSHRPPPAEALMPGPMQNAAKQLWSRQGPHMGTQTEISTLRTPAGYVAQQPTASRHYARVAR